jgi:two-component system, OmpR family, heavy metal sensor histidine kinase CusS
MRTWPRLVWPPNSMSVRLMLWYALWAVALIAGASGLLYGGIETRLEKEQDNQVLADYLRILNQVLDPAGLEAAPVAAPASAAPSYVYVRVLDEHGRTLLETPGMSTDLPVPAVADLGPQLPLEGERSTQRSPSGRLFELMSARIASGPDGRGTRYLQIALDRTEDDLLDRLRDQSWLVLVATVAVCAVVGFTIAQRSIRPVQEMSQTMQRIQSNRLHERIAVAGLPRELSDLAGTFNQMLDRLEESFQRIAQFSDNVAHELRTPVGNLQNAMEIALRRARTDADYRDVIASCLEESGRVTRILQGLLLLARGGGSSPLQLEAMEIRGELESLREVYEPLAAEVGAQIEIDAPAGLAARVDRTLARQAIANLVANSIEHTGRHGRVRLSARADGDWTAVTVADTGCGIAPEHVPHVFERFYRVEQARSESRRHAGLGLPIVKTLVEQHGGRVALESRAGEGTAVTLWFPRAA